jgi:hypothetical protein
VTYAEAMFRFFDDPASNVAYACYFNNGDSKVDHRLTGRTRFGNARAVYAERVRSRAGGADSRQS